MDYPSLSLQDFLNGKTTANGRGIRQELIKRAFELNPEQTRNTIMSTPIVGDDVRGMLGLPDLLEYNKMPEAKNMWGKPLPTTPQTPVQTGNPTPQATQPTGNPPSTPSSEKLTSEDVNTGIALSTINGMQNQPSQSDSYALIRQLSDQYQNADPMTQTLMDAIYSYQNDYANATTDEARQLAHAGAERAREIARINELDLGLMSNGENLSPEQSNLAMVNAYLNQLGEAQKKFQSVQDNLANNYSESSNDHFWRLYDEYRRQGDSDRIAAIKAGRETTGYQQERVRSLQGAIDDYGIEGGVMNQFGVSLLGQLADEDNIMGSAYANAYAMPLRNYQDNQELIKMAIQHGYNLEDKETQHKYNIEQDTNRANLQETANVNAYNRSETAKENALARDKERYSFMKGVDVDKQKELDDYRASLGDQEIEHQIDQLYRKGKELGLTGDTLTVYALSRGQILTSKSRGGKSGSKSGDGELSYKDAIDGLKKTADSLREQIKLEQDQLKDGLVDEGSPQYTAAQERITKLQRQLADTNAMMDRLNNTEDSFENKVWGDQRPTGNFNHDRPLIDSLNNYLYQEANSNPEKYPELLTVQGRRKAIVELLVTEYGFTEEYAKECVGNY